MLYMQKRVTKISILQQIYVPYRIGLYAGQLIGTPGVADVSSFGGYLKQYESCH